MSGGIDNAPSRFACIGKLAYDGWHAAMKVLRSRKRKKAVKRQGGELKPYRCPACGKWHLGTNRRWR